MEGGRQEGREGGREAGREGGRQEGREGGREAGREGGRQEGRRTGKEVGGYSTTHSPLSWQRSENECFWNTRGSRGGGEGEESKGGRNKLSNERKEALSLQMALDPS